MISELPCLCLELPALMAVGESQTDKHGSIKKGREAKCLCNLLVSIVILKCQSPRCTGVT